MQATDSEVFNALERIVSADVNDAQAYLGRGLGDGLRGLIDQSPFGSLGDAMPDAELRSSVLGFRLRLNAGNIETSDGLLFSRNNGVADDPIDSSLRIGRVITGGAFAPTGLAVPPGGGGDVYYLIEAQVAQVVGSQNRDIKNPIDQTFAPALVPKTRTNGVSFFITAGSATALPPSDPTRTPIAGLLVPAAPGVPTSNNLIDLRPVAGDRTGVRGGQGFDSAAVEVSRSTIRTTGLDTFAEIAFDACINGLRCHANTLLTSPVDLDTLISPPEVAAPDGIWYVYAHGANTQGFDSPTRAGNVYGIQFGGNLRTNCGIVLSQTAPRINGQPGASIEPAAPFTGGVTSQMGHVATLHREGGVWTRQNGGVIDYTPTETPSANISSVTVGQASYRLKDGHLEMWFQVRLDKTDAAIGTLVLSPPVPVFDSGSAWLPAMVVNTPAADVNVFGGLDYVAGNILLGLQGPVIASGDVSAYISAPVVRP